MPRSILINSDGYIVRTSSAPFTIANGKTTAADMDEVIWEDSFTQKTMSAAQPADWRPWWYKAPSTSWVKSDRHPDVTPPYTPAIPLVQVAAISRPRFDSIFAEVCGEKNYQLVLAAIKAQADIEPPTDSSALMRRAWAAFENPPTTDIDYPISDWATPGKLDPLDLTGAFFALLATSLVGDFPQIGAWLVGGCVLWAELKA